MLIGVTGDYSPFTPPALAAVQVAADTINAAGGVNGAPLEIIVEDNQTSVEGAVQGFQKLVEVDGVDFIAGWESDGRSSEPRPPRGAGHPGDVSAVRYNDARRL